MLGEILMQNAITVGIPLLVIQKNWHLIFFDKNVKCNSLALNHSHTTQFLLLQAFSMKSVL